MVKYLLEAGADVEIRNIDGDTPLFYAESTEMAELLIQEGKVNIMALNKSDHSVLDNAVNNGWMALCVMYQEKGVPLSAEKEAELLEQLKNCEE